MQKTYCDGCGVELMEMPFIFSGISTKPLCLEVNGVFNRESLVVDSKRYDLCITCKERVKGAVIAEIEAIKGEKEG